MYQGGPNDQVGMCTTTLETMDAMSANLFYYVKGKMVLVLDRPSVSEGQVIGMLSQSDVVVSNNLSGAWVLVPEGSYVRHPQMRNGKIKIKRQGWVIVEHSDYGSLLGVISVEQVKSWFADEAFLKVALIKPVVKAKSKAKAKAKAAAVDTTAPAEPNMQEQESVAVVALQAEQAAAAESPLPLSEMSPVPTSAEQPEVSQTKSGVEEEAQDTGAAVSEAAPPSPKTPGAPAAKSPVLPPLGPPAFGAPPGSVVAALAAAGFPVPQASAAPKHPSSIASAGKAVAAIATNAKVAAAKPKAKSAARPEILLPETFDDHIGNSCRSEHWKITRPYVWIRETSNLDGATVAVLREGALLCQGCLWGENHYSADGRCLRLTQDAKYWWPPEAPRPEPVFTKPELEIGFLMMEHPEVGTLVDYVPAPSRRGLATNEPQDKHRGMSEPVVSRVQDLSKLDRWVVNNWGAWIHTECSVHGPVEFKMQPHDILVLNGRPPRFRLDKGNWWMHLREGTQVYRRTEDVVLEMLGVGGLKVHGYVLREDQARTYLEHMPPQEPGMIIRMLSGFGEPLVSCVDGVPLYYERDSHSEQYGVLKRGDVVGVRKKDEKWCELVVNGDMRKIDDEGIDAAQTVEGLNSFVKIAISETKGPAKERRSTAQMPDLVEYRRAWIPLKGTHGEKLVDHSNCSDLEEGCLLQKERGKLYKEVTGLCHDRIYEENFSTLWDGDRTKLPSRKSLEAKLFDRNTTVLHASRGDVLVGGAIIKEFKVRAMALTSTSGTLGVGVDIGQPEGYMGNTFVGYIDSCASVPSSHAGSALWDVVSKLGFVIVACHPILLQSTVDFWLSRGMRRFEVELQKDCEEFRTSLLVLTQGKVQCELADLVDALPPSHLPLLVWMSTKCAEIQDDLDGVSRVFVPDDPENYF